MIRPYVCGVMTGICAGVAVLHLPLAALSGWPAIRNALAFAVAAAACLILAIAPAPAPKES